MNSSQGHRIKPDRFRAGNKRYEGVRAADGHIGARLGAAAQARHGRGQESAARSQFLAVPPAWRLRRPGILGCTARMRPGLPGAGVDNLFACW